MFVAAYSKANLDEKILFGKSSTCKTDNLYVHGSILKG